MTGHVIEIDGDRATIHAHIRAEHWVPEELAGADLPVPAALLPHGVRRSVRSSGRGGTVAAGGCRPRWNRRSVRASAGRVPASGARQGGRRGGRVSPSARR
ncbi:hypothetical protein [Streptomyces sp. 2BBP-J2]|uniref:hypothetical protein n=1 Tax=Streptomyces sp. 2BBP-J2 TaxID=2719381 RepID=UPI0039874DC8